MKRANKVVLAGGKFNAIHPGHVWLLRKAKRLGFLVVVLANDSHNDRHYAVPARERKKALEALGIADKVVVGDKGSFEKVLAEFKPNVIVLGYDQKIPSPEAEALAGKMKIKIVRFGKRERHATRSLFPKKR